MPNTPGRFHRFFSFYSFLLAISLPFLPIPSFAVRTCLQIFALPIILETPDFDPAQLTPIQDPSQIKHRLQQIPNLNRNSNLALVAGDFVFEPGLPTIDLATSYKMQAFKPPRIWMFQGEKLVREINISEYILMTIPAEEISVYRKLNRREFEGWQKKDYPLLFKASSELGTQAMWQRYYGAMVLHFSIAAPFTLHRLLGDHLVQLRIPKAQLLQWAQQGRILVGGTSNHVMFEILFLDSTWQEMLAF